MLFARHLSPQLLWIKRVSLNAWHNLMRNKLLSIATVLIISLMLFVFNLILALNFAAESVIANIGEKLDIAVEVNPNIENYTIQTFIDKLKEHSAIKEVVYISKEEALGRFGSKYPNIISFLDNHKLDNPLPDVIRIVSKDVSKNNDIVIYLEQEQFSRIINQSKLKKDSEQKTRNEKILNITTFIKRSGLWLNIIFALVAILIIFNSINVNIHNHKHEIQIMKLVGAKFRFIRAGFLLEGVMFAVSAILISVVFSKIVLGYLTRNLIGIISNENLLAGVNAILVHFEERFWFTLSWQILGAIIAGILSSSLAIELYLRKKSAH